MYRLRRAGSLKHKIALFIKDRTGETLDTDSAEQLASSKAIFASSPAHEIWKKMQELADGFRPGKPDDNTF